MTDEQTISKEEFEINDITSTDVDILFCKTFTGENAKQRAEQFRDKIIEDSQKLESQNEKLKEHLGIQLDKRHKLENDIEYHYKVVESQLKSLLDALDKRIEELKTSIQYVRELGHHFSQVDLENRLEELQSIKDKAEKK